MSGVKRSVEHSGGLLRRILADHFARVEPRLSEWFPAPVAEAARDAVERALRCRTPENGFATLRCEDCGALHRRCFTCKSRFCPTCGRVRAAEAAAQAKGRLLNVRHRHLTFTVPAQLRPLLFADRALLGVVSRAAAQATLTAIASRCRAHPLVPGVMATVHTYGRDLGFHVHVHVLCTEGGLRPDSVWQPVNFFPAQQYRRLWQHCLLSRLRRRFKGDRATQRLIGRLYRQYPTGFNVEVMSRYLNGRQAAAYCCRYTGRPPLSERRIGDYDGEWVTLTYRNWSDQQDQSVRLPAEEFLRRLLQHVWPRYARDVHYYGLYQPSRRKEHAQAVARASRFGDQALPKPALSRAERFLQALGRRPSCCPECGGRLLVEQVTYPKRRHATKSRQKARVPPRCQLALSL